MDLEIVLDEESERQLLAAFDAAEVEFVPEIVITIQAAVGDAFMRLVDFAARINEALEQLRAGGKDESRTT